MVMGHMQLVFVSFNVTDSSVVSCTSCRVPVQFQAQEVLEMIPRLR